MPLFQEEVFLSLEKKAYHRFTSTVRQIGLIFKTFNNRKFYLLGRKSVLWMFSVIRFINYKVRYKCFKTITLRESTHLWN